MDATDSDLALGHPADRADSHDGPLDQPIAKSPTGIDGFDEMTGGGLPAGRLSVIMGSPGAGKTVFALQTLVNRAKMLGEPAIFVAFEEPPPRIRRNVASFDWDMADMPDQQIVLVDARVPVDAIHAGAFDLNGLLEGLSALQAQIGARNIVFDGLDILLDSLDEERLERQELMRLDDWIRRSDVSAMITVKSHGMGERNQIRSDFLQYITDCAVDLAFDFTQTGSARTLRVVKYRGAGFAANPAPVVIGRSGLSVISFKSVRTNYPIFTDRVSSGIPKLDTLLAGGYLRGSSILVSGAPGTAKSSLGAQFIAASCARGDKALIVSFDESPGQIVRNMRSIGMELGGHMEQGALIIESLVSSGRSPEEHFVAIREMMDRHEPDCILIDPISSFMKTEYAFSSMISESLIDLAKSRGVTLFCTSLLEQGPGMQELSASRVSTIADTWLHVSYIAKDGERNRALTIVKSRGTGHSNQVRELVLDRSGLDLVDVYIAEGEVLMGSARAQKENQAHRRATLDAFDYKRQNFELQRSIADLEIAARKADQELAWKRREAELVEEAERRRLDEERLAALQRAALRRTADDATGGGTVSGEGNSP